jgi:ketosteroid isomerase-like protein
MTEQDFATHLELRDLTARYALACDQRDAQVYISVFTPDARLLVCNGSEPDDPTTTIAGHAELAQVTTMLARYDQTLHLVGQSVYEVGGDTATGVVYCVANHIRSTHDGATNHVMYIRYHDDYRLEANRTWLIATRRVLIDWTETRPIDEPRQGKGTRR